MATIQPVRSNKHSKGNFFALGRKRNALTDGRVVGFVVVNADEITPELPATGSLVDPEVSYGYYLDSDSQPRILSIAYPEALSLHGDVGPFGRATLRRRHKVGYDLL